MPLAITLQNDAIYSFLKEEKKMYGHVEHMLQVTNEDVATFQDPILWVFCHDGKFQFFFINTHSLII